MSLIKISDFCLTNTPINTESWLLKTALLSLKNNKKVIEQEYEKTIDIFDLMLEMNNILRLTEKRCGNQNAKRG